MNAWRWNTPAATGCILPVENIELLSRYGHEESAPLDRLGGGAWQAKKARLKERIREIADRLIRDRGGAGGAQGAGARPARRSVGGVRARFPYAETDDQLTAIADVMEDLARGPADGPADLRRCGLRQDRGRHARGLRRRHVAGLQVAVIAPTTLLARQHANTFAERFRGFPITVRPLSRFVPARKRRRDPGRHRRRVGRYRHRHPCAAGQGHPVPAASA
jgi:transcription-repair coupling factor (superfamily II helicase)